MNQRNGDLILSIMMLIIIFVFWYASADLSYPSYMFPMFVMIILGISSIILIIKSIISRQREKSYGGAQENDLSDNDKTSRYTLFKVLGLAASGIVYVLAINIIGFYITTIIYLGSLYFVLSGQKFNKQLGFQLSLITLVVTISVYFVFDYFLNVNVPEGFLI